MKKIRIALTFVFFIGIVIVVLYISYLYNAEKDKVNVMVDDLLMKSIAEELYFREVDSVFVNHLTCGDTVTSNTDSIVKDNYCKNSTVEEYFSDNFVVNVDTFNLKNDVLQTNYLKLNCPINISTLDSIFTISLIRKRILAKVALTVSTPELNYSTQSELDTTLYKSATYIKEIRTGLFREIKIKAFIQYPFLFIFQKVKYPHKFCLTILVTFVALVLVFISTFIFKRKVTTLPVQEKIQFYNEQQEVVYDVDEATVSKQNVKQPVKNQYQIGSLVLNTHECTLYKGNERIKTARREYELLMMFLTSADNFIKRDAIILEFWSSKIDCADKVNTSISRLRKLLSVDKSIKIVTERGVGYRLVVADGSDDKLDENDNIDEFMINGEG